MDVMTAVTTNSVLTEMAELSSSSTCASPPPLNSHLGSSPTLSSHLGSSPPPLSLSKDVESLDSATYLGTVSVSEAEPSCESSPPGSHQYLQNLNYVDNDLSAGYPPGAVYVSQSLYPANNSPSQQYYDTQYTGINTINTINTNTTQQVGQSQLLSYGGSTFLIQPGPDGSSTPLITTVSRAPPSPVQPSLPDTDISSHSLSYATRVSPATIQWLIANYETAEGVSLPRSTLYSHYLHHCSTSKQDPVNAASFGKLIRSVFLGLRTRRIGTRGNSKYHYYGIRVKPTSSLNQMEIEEEEAPPPRPIPPKKRPNNNKITEQNGNVPPDQSVQVSSTLGSAALGQYLGHAGTQPTLPHLIISKEQLPPGIDQDTVTIFAQMYKNHLTQLLESVVCLSFANIQHIWLEFWSLRGSLDQDEEEKLPISKAKLKTLFTLRTVQNFIQEADFTFYQTLVQILIPEVLRPIPPSLTQAIRNFAKSLESWLTTAMADCPKEIMTIKLATVRSFSQTLRRYTSLNHLAQAARAVLQNQAQITQMLADLNKVDFVNVQEQASWVCGCDTNTVQRLEQNFKETLQQQASLETWASWLEGVVETALAPHQGKPGFSSAARQFLLRWSFYSSMVIRDLTLRSAASFGSFHLIRLLYDEFMFYLVEHRIAKHLNMTPVAVMGLRRRDSLGQESEESESMEAGGGGGLRSRMGQEDEMQVQDTKDWHTRPANNISNQGDKSILSHGDKSSHIHGDNTGDMQAIKRAKTG